MFDDFGMDWFMDTTAWVVTIILYFAMVGMMWYTAIGSWGEGELLWQKYLITVVALPVTYIVAKMMIDKGG